MFISAVVTELADVATTQRTVVAYRTTKHREGLSARLQACFETVARTTHGLSIAFILVSNAIYVVVMFRLANWKVEFFGPSDFSSPTKELVFAWIVTSLVIQVPVTVVHPFCQNHMKSNLLVFGALLGNLTVSALSITISTKVTPRVAGAFFFLQLIAVPQAIELVGEEARRGCWDAFKEAPVDELEDMKVLEVMDWYGKRNSERESSTEKEIQIEP